MVTALTKWRVTLRSASNSSAVGSKNGGSALTSPSSTEMYSCRCSHSSMSIVKKKVANLHPVQFSVTDRKLLN